MPDRRVFWGLIALAVAARVAAVGVLQSHTVPRSTYEHGEIAVNLLAGRGFSVRYLGADGPTSQQAPLYPFLVAGAYWIGGVGTPLSLLILELAQAGLGGVLVAGVMALAGSIAPKARWVAPLAGLIAAVDPTLVYPATHVQVVGLATTLLIVALAWAERTARTGRSSDAIGSGVCFGLLALADPILGLSAPAMAWSIARSGEPRRSPRLIVLVAVTASVCVAPWVVRNFRVHGEFVPIKSSFGYAFWQGNCALSEGTDKVIRPSVARIADRPSSTFRDQNQALWEARHEAGYIDDIALTPDDYRQLGSVSEPERSRFLFRRAWADLGSDPTRYIRLCLRRLRFFVFFDETNPKTRNLVYRVSHLGLTIAALIGLILARSEVRRNLGPSILTAGLIAAFHTLAIVSARFQIPIEPLMAVWAASGLSRWIGDDQPRLPTTSKASGSSTGLRSVRSAGDLDEFPSAV